MNATSVPKTYRLKQVKMVLAAIVALLVMSAVDVLLQLTGETTHGLIFATFAGMIFGVAIATVVSIEVIGRRAGQGEASE